MTELERALASDPDNGMARVFLEQTRHGANPSAELVRVLEAAVADIPGDLAVTAAVAGAVYGTGDEGSDFWSRLATANRRLGRAAEAAAAERRSQRRE